MQVGTLVRLVLVDATIIHIGVIVKIDNDFEYGRVYNVAFTDSEKTWCLENHLEVLCKQAIQYGQGGQTLWVL